MFKIVMRSSRIDKTPPRPRRKPVIVPIKGPWKKDEDDYLKNLVMTYGPKNWTFISSKMNELGVQRLGKQCRERWYNHLSPDVRKDPWSEEEDKIIVELHQKYGPKWTTISTFLKGRTPNSIKNRWNSTLKKTINGVPKRKRRKTFDESLMSSGRTASPMDQKILKRRKSNGDLIMEAANDSCNIREFLTDPYYLRNFQIDDFFDYQQLGQGSDISFGQDHSNLDFVQQPDYGAPEKKPEMGAWNIDVNNLNMVKQEPFYWTEEYGLSEDMYSWNI